MKQLQIQQAQMFVQLHTEKKKTKTPHLFSLKMLKICVFDTSYMIWLMKIGQNLIFFQNKDIMNKFYLHKKYMNFQMADREDVINHIHI